MGVAKSLPSAHARPAPVCPVRGRDLHRVVADLGARVGSRPDRERLLARFPCRSPSVGSVFVIKNKRDKKNPPALGRNARDRARVRGRPRVLALVDPVHLGRQLDAARQPRVDLRDAGGLGTLEAAAKRRCSSPGWRRRCSASGCWCARASGFRRPRCSATRSAS